MTTTTKERPIMFYFGPWDEPGHYFFSEDGGAISVYPHPDVPWKNIDGWLQPNCTEVSWKRTGPEVEGEALLHHKDGWTALCFWDRTVDARMGCNSNYFAKGTFTFEEMVELAKTRFSERWTKMKFKVKNVTD